MPEKKTTKKIVSRETKDKGKKAPDKMIMFAEEYVIDFNGTRAYKAVYGENISDEVAASSAWRLLRKEKVCNETERLLAEVKNRRNERKARVTAELEEIAYDKNAVDITRDKDGEILEVSRKDRIRSLELLGKMEAMFTDKVEQTGPIEIKHTFDPKGV